MEPSTDDIEQRYNLITRNLAEMVGEPEVIKAIMKERPLRIYFGTAPTGRMHIAYFVPLLKIADYLKAGCEVTILIADLHAYLDSMKSTLELLQYRTEYYTLMVKSILESIGIDISKLKFVKGMDYQLSKEYMLDVYKMNSLTTLHEAKHAGAEIVKQSDNPMMTSLLYPSLQALDEHYLNCDCESSGLDQRKLFMYSRKLMPKLGYKKRHYFMTEMVPGLRFDKKETNTLLSSTQDNLTNLTEELKNVIQSSQDKETLLNSLKQFLDKNAQETNNVQLEKMSASNQDSKIDLLDTKNQIKNKINKAYCFPGDVDDNSPLVLLEKIIFRLLEHKNQVFIINRPEKFGGQLKYNTFEEVKNSFKSQELHPADLKLGIIDALDSIIGPIREKFESPEMKALSKKAYPQK